MRFLRNRFVSKFLAVLFLLLIVESTMHATVSFALTTPGPHQPEYMSYEDAGSPDMVNLVTGDFTFNLPLLEVPGPEGNFSIPLTYNAGIGPEQEASWVGLGFNINVGAITRQINQYPDDASGMFQKVAVQSPGVRGWTASIGNLINFGWNTNKGYNGTTSFGTFGLVNYSFDNTGGNFEITPGKFDAEALAGSLLSGIKQVGPAQFKTALPVPSLKQAAWSAAFNALLPNRFSLGNVGGSSGAAGYYPSSQRTESGFLNLYTNYWTWLDNSRTESMYGVLSLQSAINNSTQDNQIKSSVNGAAPQGNGVFFNGKHPRGDLYPNLDVGTTTDVNYYMPAGLEYKKVSSPALLAVDNYMVNAPEVSGSIKPLRLDVGSVSSVRNMYPDQKRYNVLRYLDYKVPFVYSNAVSNSYLYPTTNKEISNFGLQFTGSFDTGTFGLNDSNFGIQRVEPSVQLSGNKIAQSNHIEYLSNRDIHNTSNSFTNGFMDYFTGAARQTFRNPYIFEQSLDGWPLPSPSIGGFSITSGSGVTYHFALPTFDFLNSTGITSVSNSAVTSSISRDGGVAGTWVLTGITGPDFVDVNSNGSIDETDWGYWVKFNYGIISNTTYGWTSSLGSGPGVIDPTGAVYSSSSGLRQSCYLNSIETRSHVAVFIKDGRMDGRGYNNAIPLSLNEIALLTREDYKKLTTVYGLPSDSGTINSWWNINSFYPTGGNTSAGDFVFSQALRRIKFIQSYDLCPGTPNSIAANQSKLTLTRLKIIGRNGTSVTPDYKFEYGLDQSFITNYWNNPAYNVNKWDGWGMYNSSGTADYRGHKTSPSDTDGTAWSLNRITTPLGSTIEVNYERDTYSSISGADITEFVNYNNPASSSGYYGPSSMSELAVPDPSKFSVGDVVNIIGHVEYACYQTGPYTLKDYSGDYTITYVGANSISLGTNFRGITNCNTGQPVYFNYDNGSIKRKIKAKKGGNIRVSSIQVKDGTMRYKTSYQYNLSDGRSSGVVAREPEFEQISTFDFDKIPNYPYTPVMYSQVAVLTGKLDTDQDFHTRTVYEFETPNLSMIEENVDKIQFDGLAPGTTTTLLSVKRNIYNHTAKLGSLKKVTVYDKYGAIAKLTSLNYTEELVNSQGRSNQGLYSSSTLMHDRIFEPPAQGFIGGITLKMTRTSEVKFPYVLKSINTQLPDGFSTSSTNSVWDFISGQVIEKLDKSPSGIGTKTVIKPAYYQYPSMGSKVIDINNKNMLMQESALYNYKTDVSGNSIGLVGASAQTWKNIWGNYRYLFGASYIDQQEGPNVWRKSQKYVYTGNYANLRADGSLNFATSNEFSFASGAANTGWQKTGEVTRYDHYSAALEGKDLNNIFSSSKKDIGGKQVYANSSNATYHEFAYSGAEDWDASGTGTYLGGEVAKADGTKVTKTSTGTETHTGQFAVAVLNTNGKSFKYYRSVSQNSPLVNNRVYRVSAWTNSPAGAIYYNLNNSGEQTVLPLIEKKVGNWYQINAEIPVGTFSSLEVGVKSTSGTVSFDDFRFQPRDGSLTANVYDPVTGAVTFVLDNQNMFTQYEYNDRGQLVKTYSESFLYGVKLVSESKVNYKGFNTN